MIKIGIFDKYDKCYKESIEIGFCKKGEPCKGEMMGIGRINTRCLHCNHIEYKLARAGMENLKKKGVI